MPLRPLHECRQCVSTWTIKEVKLSKGSSVEGRDTHIHLNLDWRACLEKLTCETKTKQPNRWSPGISLIPPYLRGKIGLGDLESTGDGRWIASIIGTKKYSAASLLGSPDQYVCCKSGAGVGGNVFPTTDCCTAKKEIICKCYATQVNSPPFSVEDCCVAGSEKNILLKGVRVVVADDGTEHLGISDGNVKTEIEQYLAWSLAKFAAYGRPGSCTGTGGFLEWADEDVPEPVPGTVEWLEKCRCVMPTGDYDSLKCP